VAWLALAAACLGNACGGSAGSPAEPEPEPAPPSIVFIVADDLDMQGMQFMPAALSQIAATGMTFRNMFVPTSICAASRASILTGELGHNHTLYTNSTPRGGFDKFSAEGRETSTIATWLQGAGYRTIFLGKYLNGYPGGRPESYVPPGWDEWHADFSPDDAGESGLTFYDYSMNDDGVVTTYHHAPGDYVTDVVAAKALDALRAVPADQPFFLYVAPRAPHRPAIPAPRHAGLFKGSQAPRTPNFDERDVRDKPRYVRLLPPFGDRDVRLVDELYRDRLACLQAVDEMVASLLGELAASGRLASTYVVLTSDNGFMLGPHRFIRGKEAPYEESIRVPLLVRGPGVPAGSVSDAFVLNVDFAPTFVEWARASAPAADGRSLRPLLATGSTADWRTDVPLEHWQKQLPGAEGDEAIPDFSGVRTAHYTYVEHATGEMELYDLDADPYQLDNQAPRAPADLVAKLSSRTTALRGCQGTSCW
jgi:N-acetylglucosamine-6-sulfatase